MFKPSVAYALMAGVLSFAFVNTASAAPFNADLSKQYMSGDKAAYLAGVHTKKGLDCAACIRRMSSQIQRRRSINNASFVMDP